MGTFAYGPSTDANGVPIITTVDEYGALLSTVRASVPSWCRAHDEFRGVADEVIVGALRGFNPASGVFAARLKTRARDRVARTLVRRHAPTPASPLSPHDDEDDRESVTYGESSPDYEQVDAACDVARFCENLDRRQSELVRLLSAGYSQAEASLALRIHPRKVSRMVRELRPKAAAFFQHPTGALAA